MKFLSPSVTTAVFLLDRITKILILNSLGYAETVPVLPFFHITHLENTGVAFGLGQNQNTAFTILTVGLLFALLLLRRKWEGERPNDMLLKVGLALVIGGALGNLYDRIAYGSVVDFLLFFIGKYQWPAFNVADSAICVGAGLLIWSQWRADRADASTRP